MQRINLLNNLKVSRIAYGMWRLLDDPEHSPAHTQAKIEACLETGMTTIDQADIYGDYGAEAALGETIAAAPHLRDKIEIVTKCGIVAPVGRYADHRVKHYNTSTEYITQSAETSLRLMNTDHIDLLLVHRPDPFMDAEETGRALDALIDNGKVRAVGVSNFKPHDMELLAAAMDHPLVTNQIEISLKCNEALTNGDIAYLQQHNISPMAWSPLGGGALFGDNNKTLLATLNTLAREQSVDVGTIAIAWLLAHPANIMPVIGTNSLSRIRTLGNAERVNVDRETWFELYELANGHAVP